MVIIKLKWSRMVVFVLAFSIVFSKIDIYEVRQNYIKEDTYTTQKTVQDTKIAHADIFNDWDDCRRLGSFV